MPKQQKLLTFLIPTIVGRESQFRDLTRYLWALAQSYPIDVLGCKDNKEMSIGAKRQKLIESCETEYFVMVDDDDVVPGWYISEVKRALATKPDCITYQECVMFDDKQYSCNHSLRYLDWADNVEGYDHVRTPFYKDVIRTDLALKAGFSDMRYGEDYDFAKRLLPLLNTEVHVDRIMYYYYGTRLTPKEHKTRYGIK